MIWRTWRSENEIVIVLSCRCASKVLVEHTAIAKVDKYNMIYVYIYIFVTTVDIQLEGEGSDAVATGGVSGLPGCGDITRVKKRPCLPLCRWGQGSGLSLRFCHHDVYRYMIIYDIYIYT